MKLFHRIQLPQNVLDPVHLIHLRQRLTALELDRNDYQETKTPHLQTVVKKLMEVHRVLKDNDVVRVSDMLDHSRKQGADKQCVIT
jgi:predicted RNA-binding protein Jag